MTSEPTKMIKAAANLMLRLVVGAAIVIHDALAFIFARPLAWIAALKPLVRLSAWVAALPPWAVVVVLALPVVITEPFKLLGLWWLAIGQGKAGLLALAFGHGASLILVERIFTAGLPALRQYCWFARLHDRFVAYRAGFMAWIWSLPVAQSARRAVFAVRAAAGAVRAWFRTALTRSRKT
jgi:hypothetical protein